ncbi:hypothetical protein DERF_008186 [Dermatophagoides farinae]|uniref:Uncharacterized protein n=1 Tax=Dermatophagoides farinae TaxID=6954 RepID=A0A922L421_DERFA|nr:hypothetical protein DERF_008186 [Dermatophagoides farinae]
MTIAQKTYGPARDQKTATPPSIKWVFFTNDPPTLSCMERAIISLYELEKLRRQIKPMGQADLHSRFISQCVGSRTTPGLSAHHYHMHEHGGTSARIGQKDQYPTEAKKKSNSNGNNHRRERLLYHSALSFVSTARKINMYKNGQTSMIMIQPAPQLKRMPRIECCRTLCPLRCIWMSQRSLTGPGQFGSVLYRFGFSDDPNCQWGHDIQIWVITTI